MIYSIVLTATYSPTDIVLTSIGATTPLADDGINENTEVNTEVGVFSATDADGAPPSAFTWTLIDADGIADADNAKFSINGDRLVLAESPDFETQESYAIHVQVSDGALVYAESFVIGVNDLG